MPILITQSHTPPPVVQGAYRWLFPEVEGEAASQELGEEIWPGYAAVYSTAEQFELFQDAYVPDEIAFRYLVEQWHTERGVASSTTEILLLSFLPEHHRYGRESCSADFGSDRIRRW